jgi:DNA repair protein RadC
MKKSFTIHDLPPSERPRERLMKFGPEALSSQELLAIILGRGIRGESVMVTAQRLLSTFGSIKAISEASLEELDKVRGIDLAKATQIKAAFELAKRAEEEFIKFSQKPIQYSEDIIKIIAKDLKNKKKEYCKAILLNRRNQVIDIVTISIGNLDTNIVHPREVFKEAIQKSAASIILVHNHPSGDPNPSKGDIEITKRLIKTGKVIGIDVLDHIIIANTKFISFKREKLM